MFQLQKKNSVNDADWTTIATNIVPAGAAVSFADNSATNDSAFYRLTLL